MKKLLFLLTLCSHVFLIQAQNTTLLDKEEPKFPDLSSYCVEELKKLDNINNLVQQGYQQFSRSHIQYSYGIPKIKFHFSRYNSKLKEVRAIAQDLFKNRKQLKALYDAALPVFVEQFKRMTPREQQGYINELQRGLAYIKAFDPEKEKADLERITKEGKRFDDEKGMLNAFIYRRLVNDGISKKEGLYWLKRMKKSLSAHRSKATKTEDEYFLEFTSTQNKNIVRGRIFGTNQVAVFEKKEGQYQLVPIEEGLRYYWKGATYEDKAWFVFETAEGNYKIYLFRTGKAPLAIGETYTESEVGALEWRSFQQQNAWSMGSYKDGVQLLYAFNKEGKLEKNILSDQAEEIALDENHPRARLFLFQFKSGERQLLYNKNIKGLDALTTSTQKIYRRDNTTYQQEYWITDDQNKLYFCSLRQGKLVEFGTKDAIKSVKVVDNDKTIIKYQTGHADLYLFDRKRNIKEVPLPKEFDIANAKHAWYIERKGTKQVKAYYITLANDLIGVIDENGKIVLAPEYESIDLQRNMVYIKKAGKWGLAEKNGKVVLTPAYESIKVNEQGFLIKESGKWGQLDKNGKTIIAPK